MKKTATQSRSQPELEYAIVHCTPYVYYSTGQPINHVTLAGDRKLALKGTYHRFGIGAIPRGFSGRKESFGPEVPGPWAFAFGLATVIDNRPDLRAAERAQDLEVSEGSLLMIDGVVYRVVVERREFIKLVAVRSLMRGEESIGEQAVQS
jgi:hypothetical protein